MAKDGKVASYIPALAKAEQTDLSVAVYHVSNTCHSAGDVDKRFTLQSISKVLALALVLSEEGPKSLPICWTRANR